MRLKLVLLSLCTFVITAAALAFILTKGEDYHAALMTAPERMKDEVASRKKGLRRRVEELAWRVKERESAAAVDRIMSVSGRVFAGSPETARELRHLRRLIAGRLADDRAWIRLDPALPPGILVQTRRDAGIELGPGMAALPPLDAARAFWEHAQRSYDDDVQRSRATDSFASALASLRERTYEAELRAHRVGCAFHAAGGAECAAGAPGRLRCFPTAAEVVAREARAGSVTPAACVELERVAAGNPASLQDFATNWTLAECSRRAAEAVAAPGWRGSDALCAEVEAEARARGLAFIRPLR